MNLTEFLKFLECEPDWEGRGPITVATRGASGDTPLHAALWARDDEAAQALLRAGADVNAEGEERYTPLHVAVAQNNVALVLDLLKRGASWDVVSELGSSPRQTALLSDRAELRALAKAAN
jgi:ankyrin repeat protein